jgi:hypothetical protein
VPKVFAWHTAKSALEVRIPGYARVHEHEAFRHFLNLTVLKDRMWIAPDGNAALPARLAGQFDDEFRAHVRPFHLGIRSTSAF